MDKTVLFIVADEATNSAERDSMIALSHVLDRIRDPDTKYLIRKAGEPSGDEQGEFGAVLPQNNSDYARIPRLNDDFAKGLTGEVTLIGVGHSTLAGLLRTADDLEYEVQQGRDDVFVSRMNFITDKIEWGDEKVLSNYGVRVFAPLPAKYPVLEVHTLDALPHTNSQSYCLVDYEAILKDKNFSELQEMLASDAPFVFAVLNAGFLVKNTEGVREWQPYKEHEAYIQGYNLGGHVREGTNLVVVEGGPNSIKDQEEFDEDAMSSFCRGYQLGHSNKYNAEPRIISHSFDAERTFNIVKAGYILAKRDNCAGFISNSDDFGTMEGALLHVDNKAKLLATFPFHAHGLDMTGRLEKILTEYNRKGITILTRTDDDDETLVINRFKDEPHTPVQQKDAAVQIISALNIAMPGHDFGPLAATLDMQ